LQLADAERRAYWGAVRVAELEAEIRRVGEWRRITVGAIVAVALFAILMLGIVAFKVADDAGDAGNGTGNGSGSPNGDAGAAAAETTVS
jgi:hypothetical protein